MTMMKHELKQGRISFCVWTVSIAFLIVICILLFPEMKGQMEGVSKIFSAMGSFTQAFGMDKINFGALTGFYAIECGNILGMGGAFFAAFTAVNILAKEEKDKTAEFLLTHPVSRRRIVTEKLMAVMIQIVGMNILVLVLALVSIAAIGEPIPWKETLLLHLAYSLLQIELAGICFGISAFCRRGSIGIGLGIATVMYFLNLIVNISEKAKALKYITPFGYAEGSEIVSSGRIDLFLVILGMVYTAVGIGAAYYWYCKKDIQ